MKPVEQFFAEYDQERTAFYQTEIELLAPLAPLREGFFSLDCHYDSRQGMVEHSRVEQILSVSRSGEATLLETTGKHSSEKIPLRYHLRPSGESWRIHQAETQCPCRGTGTMLKADCRF
jgi:hypothetical protein